MTIQGYDTAETAVPLIAKSLAAKMGFVGRYYGGSPGKDLTLDEARALSDAGLKIVTVFEAHGDSIANFNAAQGAKDAAAALKLALACCQPKGTPIYFAVDCDPTPAQISANIIPYFAAIKGVLAPAGYPVGNYGSGDVCTTLHFMELATYHWVGGAMGWRGSRAYAAGNRWHILQHLPGDPHGFGRQVDPNDAIDGDFGGWSLAPAA